MLEAYCWPRSADPGQVVGLHVSTDAAGFDGHRHARRRRAARGLARRRAPPSHHATPADASANGCGWPVALEIPVGDWPSGYYAVTLTAGDERAEAFLVVRAGSRERAPILLVLSTSTYDAYNDWGGPSLYTGGTQVSMRRPMAPGFLTKPEPHRRKMQPHPDREALWFFEWAEPLGLSVWSGGAGWWNWERPFLHWAERNGYRVDVAISTDLETEPGLLDGYRSFVCVGHDEYWSWGMREALDAHTGGRRQRGDLQRQHVLLAGPVRPRRRHDDVLQVRLRRGPGARDTAMNGSSRRPVVGSAGRLARDHDDRADVHARRLFALRTRRASRLGRLHRAAPGSLALRGHRPALRRRARPGSHDRRVRGGRVRADHRARRACRCRPTSTAPPRRSRSWRPRPPGCGPSRSSRCATRTSPASSRTPPRRCGAPAWRDHVHEIANNHAVLGVFTTPARRHRRQRGRDRLGLRPRRIRPSTGSRATCSTGWARRRRYRSSQSSTSSKRCTRCVGLPERVSSWLSPGNRTNSTSRRSARSTVNSCSPWLIGQRRSSSECRISVGVVICSA